MSSPPLPTASRFSNWNMGIPRVFHQIWFQGEANIPPHLQQYRESWKQLHPHFRFFLWDQPKIEALLAQIKIDWISELYDSYDKMIQKIDFAKYVILYVFGGIYMDVDAIALKALDPLLEDAEQQEKNAILISSAYDFMNECVLALFRLGMKHRSRTLHGMISNGTIMAAPRHPLLWTVLKQCKLSRSTITRHVNNTMYIHMTTGPLMFTLAAIRYQNETWLPTVQILESVLFEPCDVYTPVAECKTPPESYGRHVHEKSWIGKTDRVFMNIRTLITRQWCFLMIIIIVVVLWFNVYARPAHHLQRF